MLMLMLMPKMPNNTVPRLLPSLHMGPTTVDLGLPDTNQHQHSC